MARNTGISSRLDPRAAGRAVNFRYFGETVSELRRVTWPTRQETVRLTLMVLSVAAALGVFLGVIDMLFARVMDIILG